VAAALMPAAVAPAAAQQLVDQWGGPGTALGRFRALTGLAVNAGDTLYVADPSLQRITLFDRNGTALAAWNIPGTAPGRIDHPVGLAVDTRGDLYVSDSANERIQRFHADGTFVEAFGDSGSGEGQFIGPSGVTMTPDRQLYAVDAGNRRVHQIDWSTSPPHWVRTLAETLPLVDPTDVVLDSAGNIYIIERSTGETVKLAPDGSLITRWQAQGNGSEPAKPVAALVDGAVMYASDPFNGVVQTYDLTGHLLLEWPDQPIPTPTRLALDRERRLFVACSDARQVFVFQLPLATRPASWGNVKSLYRGR